MRVYEILTESKDETLQEGPILNKIGTGIGKAVGTAAKGIGAVAGGVMGLGRAIKKGYQAGKSTVGGAGDDEEETGTASGQSAGSSSAKNAGSSATAAPAPQAAAKTKAAPGAKSVAAKAAGKTAAPTDDTAQVATAAGKVALKDIKASMSKMKKPEITKIKKAIDARLQKAA